MNTSSEEPSSGQRGRRTFLKQATGMVTMTMLAPSLVQSATPETARLSDPPKVAAPGLTEIAVLAD